MYLQINTVKYDTDWEITNTYENLQIVWSQFFTDKLIFIYIRYNLNIYWFIGIGIRLVWYRANRYSVLLEFLENSNSHSILEFKGKKNLSQLPILDQKINWFPGKPTIFPKCYKPLCNRLACFSLIDTFTLALHLRARWAYPSGAPFSNLF